MSDIQQLIDQYAAGTEQLRQAVTGMTADQMNATPIPGKWSTRQVVCHIADFEPVYADRMKRVIVEETPTFFGGDPDLFAAGLAYDKRDVNVELDLIQAVRQQMTCILQSRDTGAFQRLGNHSVDGPMSLETLLRRITEHLPHHVRFIDDKRKAIAS